MAEEDTDLESKTEEPSPKKLQDAIEKGNFIHSKEVTNAFVLLSLTFVISWILPLLFNHFALKLKLIFEHLGDIKVDQGQIWNLCHHLISGALIALSPLFILIIVSVVLSSFMQHGTISFNMKSLEFNFSKLSITEGIKRIFSRKNFMEFIKNITKVFFVGIFLYLVIESDIKSLKLYQDMSIATLLTHYHIMIIHLMICVTITSIVLAVLGYSYQRFEYYKSLYMTKHELKEEYKQLEGDPLIKRRIYGLRMTRARNNLKKNVPKAAVIITNPTHYAIALEYDATMVAPKLIAKGLDIMAQQIRETAEEYNIPIVEDPPLARGLYKNVKLLEYIPEEYYNAVGKIIGYIYSKNKK